jgi:hypothetical protein
MKRVTVILPNKLVQQLPYIKPSKKKLEEYIKLMESGAAFPPVHIWIEDDRLMFKDGAHRVAAAKALGKDLLIKTCFMYAEKIFK